jgi:hypothetical protein
LPYGLTAKSESVSVIIGTPALCALRGFSQAISNSSGVSSMRPFVTASSCGWVKSTMLRGNVSVGRTALPDFNIDALVVETVSVENEIDAGPPRGGGTAAGPEIGPADRGMLQLEAFVDLVVLDPDRVIDRATFEQPTTRRREDGVTKHDEA